MSGLPASPEESAGLPLRLFEFRLVGDAVAWALESSSVFSLSRLSDKFSFSEVNDSPELRA